MGISNNGNLAAVLAFLLSLLNLTLTPQAANSFKQYTISFDSFNTSHRESFEFLASPDSEAKIDQGSLQLTPDTINTAFIDIFYNRSGRIMYKKPFRLWRSDQDGGVLASFNSSFVINNFRNASWNGGHGLAFVIAPNLTLPEASDAQYLGLTNAASDGSRENYLLAIEFDTEKQDFDPDDNHIGLNVNSVRSRNFTANLTSHNIVLEDGSSYIVWVDYNGESKLIEVYMAKYEESGSQSKPSEPLLSEEIDLRHVLKEVSYFGFAASTGRPQIQLNCVLKWSLQIDVIPKKKDRKWVIFVGVGVAAAMIGLVVLGGAFYVRRKRRKARGEAEDQMVKFKWKWLPGMPREFKYKELKKATNNFHESNRLGEGGFGIVYRGVLHEKENSNCSIEVAVKKFSRDSIKSKDDFMAELAIIHRLRHKHLVRLVGWCYEKGKLLLVYDFMPNGSVDGYLYDTSGRKTLNWSHRYKILTGITAALHYLHNECDQKVVHRDLKASNILLDADYNARLGDFGLARALENERNSYAELGLGGVPGTMGYVAPECFHTGSATPESDVYGFGAVVLEVVCGRSPGARVEHEQNHYALVDWVWMLYREGRIEEAVDSRVNGEFDVDEAKRLLLLGLACSHPIAGERPHTAAIFQIMNGTLPVPHMPPFKPVFQWPSLGYTISSICNSYSSMTTSSEYEYSSRTRSGTTMSSNRKSRDDSTC